MHLISSELNLSLISINLDHSCKEGCLAQSNKQGLAPTGARERGELKQRIRKITRRHLGMLPLCTEFLEDVT